ncbi:MAG: helix-turn-helix transcriptional regulator [Thermodesulfobacteriota bacterium]|nr:helix-turn-helix transcriptional regulator [Thermodesulfobacteriota bacterium]
MEKKTLFSTKEVAEFLSINEKMVYTLISEKGLPATKVTGKWLFPRDLVEQWLENHTINNPRITRPLHLYHGLLIISGSNDILLDRTISLFNSRYTEHVAVFGNIGSMGGLRALKRNLCHIASCHLLQEDEEEYNFDFASQELGTSLPVLVNFCLRNQGLLVAKGNPKAISAFSDLGRPEIRMVNRPKGTGTRLLLDKELEKVGLKGETIEGYDHEMRSHMDVALEVLAGRADVGLTIKPTAGLFGLDFIPIRWERYDLLIQRGYFFEQAVQLFFGLLHEPQFRKITEKLDGYDLSMCGKMVFPQQSGPGKGIDGDE